ncbi:MAG: HlyC/CorC family transporter [Chitinophagaceae bacterium]|nr:HlyC/CorC family transporter [Chitinophagaceae bacterium]MCB9055259.1 HlyC/CorC family transporter [Chitinophagales bacterium]
MDWSNILLFVLTLVLMAFFAGIEMAYYSANRLSIELKKQDAKASSRIVSIFMDFPDKFLGVTLIGYTIFLVFLGLEFSTVMMPVWRSLKVESGPAIVLIEIAVTTFLVLVFAELIPRAIFRAKSISLLYSLAPVTNVFYRFLSPVAFGLIRLAEWLLKYIFNVRVNKNKETLNRNGLKNFFLNQAEGEKQDRNTQLMENAQELPKIKIRQCLVPRKEVIGVESSSSIAELRQKFVETKLSKLLVYEENIDHIKGYVHQLDLFKNPVDLQSILLPIPAVPESMSAADLIGKFSKERKSIAWVVDEFGGTAGIITMEDVLEELFGEIKDEYDIEEFIEKQLSENEFMFSGRLELDYLEEKYGFEFNNVESETLSGYIISHHETIPKQKERIIAGDFEFDVIKVSDTRIEIVKLKRLK